MSDTKRVLIMDRAYAGGTGDAGIAERLKLRRAASGTTILALRERIQEYETDPEQKHKVKGLRQELREQRALARLAQSTVQVPGKGGFAG